MAAVTMSKPNFQKQRRKLLKQLAAVPLGAGVSMLGGKEALAMGCSPNAKSLVCLFMAGGADSFNMFVPGSSAGYSEYLDSRGEIAIPESRLLDVSDANQGAFGFNALLPALRDLYVEDRLAVIANVGTLIRPTSKSDYLAEQALPEALFAHNTQQKLWQTGAGIVSGSSSFGWGGAITDHATTCNGPSAITPAFSIAGATSWLDSINSNYISLNSSFAVQRMFGLDNISDWIPPNRLGRVGNTIEDLIAQGEATGNAAMLRTISNGLDRATVATASLHTSLQRNTLPQMQYNSQNKLASQLHLVARLIASREELGMSHQVFFVQMDGFDTHSDQSEREPLLMQDLNEAVGAFQATIDDIRAADSVTTFTASDFGRTLTSNGNGTDHGWGGHNFVFGNAVDGGRIIGDMPSYARVDNPDDAGEDDGSFAGRIIPKISVNQYGATLSSWMGVDEAALNSALPDLQNFAVRDLGFMKA